MRKLNRKKTLGGEKGKRGQDSDTKSLIAQQARTQMQATKPSVENIVLLGELTSEEAGRRFKECDIVLLPVGSVEQHGPHLPLDTDSYDAYWLAQEVAKKVTGKKPLVLPQINYGVSYHHMKYPGTISLSPSTLSDIVYEVCLSLIEHGVKKVLIVNGHGGNRPALQSAAQRLAHETGTLICIDSGEIVASKIKKIVRSRNDVHSGEYETSTSLANREALVRKDRIRKGEMRFASRFFEFDAKDRVVHQYRMDQISSTGVLGNPTRASKEKGELLWKGHIKNLVSLVEELKGIDKEPVKAERGG